MNKIELINKIENGKQVGIRKFIKHNNRDFFCEYAVQKINGKYISYTSE